MTRLQYSYSLEVMDPGGGFMTLVTEERYKVVNPFKVSHNALPSAIHHAHAPKTVIEVNFVYPKSP